MVSGNVPVDCFGPTTNTRYDVPDPVIEAGKKPPAIFEGNPDTVKFTFPAKPFNAATLKLKMPIEGWPTVRLDGDAVIVKSGVGAVTTRLTVVVCVL